MSFSISIAGLSFFQAVLVALPQYRPPFDWMPRSPWWALVPAVSIIVVVFGIEAAPGSADALTWLALLAVPPLAAFALGWLVHGTTPAWALLAVPLFLLAWASQDSLAGETAAALLSGLGCIALGWLLVSVVPAHWLRWGVYAMAAIDAALVAAELLQGPSSVLSAAAPANLPRFQVLDFGAARMGFGDAFLAATVGCLLALPADGPKSEAGVRFAARRQLLGAELVAVLALAFDLLFFALDTLPATVPVALALALIQRFPSMRMTKQGDGIDRNEPRHREADAEP
jgi:hypothetical protein